MNREQMVERIVLAVEDGPTWRQARVILDALLPQVSTVAELEALPNGTHLACLGEIYYWRAGINMLQQRFHGRFDCDPDDVLAEVGPLTVVWTPPEVTA